MSFRLPVSLLACLAALPAAAQTHTWIPGSGDWTNAAQWNPASEPDAASENVSLPNNAGSSYTVTLDKGAGGSATVGKLTVRTDARLFIADGNNLILDLTGFPADARLDNGGFIDIGGQTDNSGYGLRLAGPGDAKLSGSGTLRLNHSLLTTDHTPGQRLLNTSTIQGSGRIIAALVNNSASARVSASSLGESLQVEAYDAELHQNKGVLEAVSGGELKLVSGVWRNKDGIIRANTGAGQNSDSRVFISTEVRGGRIEDYGGKVRLSAAWLRGDLATEGSVKWRGTIAVQPNGDIARLSGTFEAQADDATLLVPVPTAGLGSVIYVQSDTDSDGDYDAPVTLSAGTSQRAQLWIGKDSELRGWDAVNAFDTLLIGQNFTLGGSGTVAVPFIANEGFIAGFNNSDGPLTFSGNFPINNSKGRIYAENGGITFHSSVDNHATIGGSCYIGIMEVGPGGSIRMESGATIEGGLLRTHGTGRFYLGNAVLDGTGAHPVTIGRGVLTDLGPRVEGHTFLRGSIFTNNTPLVTARDGAAQTIHVENVDVGGVETPVTLTGGAGGGIRLNDEADVLNYWTTPADRLHNYAEISGLGSIYASISNHNGGTIIAADPNSNDAGHLSIQNASLVNSGSIAAGDHCTLHLLTDIIQASDGGGIFGNIEALETGRVEMFNMGVYNGFVTDNGGLTSANACTFRDVTFQRGPAGSGLTASLAACALEGHVRNTGLLVIPQTNSPGANSTLYIKGHAILSGSGELHCDGDNGQPPSPTVFAGWPVPDVGTFEIASGQRLTGPWHSYCRFINNGIVELPAGQTANLDQQLSGSGSWTASGVLNVNAGGTFTGTMTAAGLGALINFNGTAPIVATGGGNLISGNGGTVIATGGANIVGTNSGSVVAFGGGNIVATGGGNILATGGGNLISGNGGTIVATGGGNIVATGGGNLISGNGGTIVATGGGNLRGNIGPGASPGRLDIHSDVVIPAGDHLFVELAGTQQGVSYDFLNVSQITCEGELTGHDVALAGTLDVRLLSGFQGSIQNSHTFTVLTTTGAITQFAFSNVAAGRVTTTDKFGTFAVALSPNGKSVILSDFQPLPHPCVAWATGYGLSGANAQPAADPDHDGQPNCYEFAFNTNPNSGTQTPPITAQQQGTNIVFTTIRRREQWNRLAYVLETSSDLTVWTTPSSLNVTITPAAGDMETVTLTLPAAGRTFARMRVTAL